MSCVYKWIPTVQCNGSYATAESSPENRTVTRDRWQGLKFDEYEDCQEWCEKANQTAKAAYYPKQEEFEAAECFHCWSELESTIATLTKSLEEARDGFKQIAALCPELRHHGGIGEDEYWSPEHRHLVKVVGEIARAFLSTLGGGKKGEKE